MIGHKFMTTILGALPSIKKKLPTPGIKKTTPTTPPIKKPTLTIKPGKPAGAYSPTQKAAIAHRAQAAAQHALRTAGKLTKLHPSMSAKIRALGNATMAKSTHIQGDTILGIILGALPVDGPSGGGAGDTGDAPSGPVYGPSPGDPVNQTVQFTDATEAAATIGDIAVQMLPTIATLNSSGKTDLAQQGQAIVDRANWVVNNLASTVAAHRAL